MSPLGKSCSLILRRLLGLIDDECIGKGLGGFEFDPAAPGMLKGPPDNCVTSFRESY
jgi:hypothetical protein